MNPFIDKFTINEGNVDRTLRVIVGLWLLSWIFTKDGPGRLWGLIGLVPLLTGMFGICPLYSILGINTCPVGKAGRG
jgi:hypothetical protein